MVNRLKQCIVRVVKRVVVVEKVACLQALELILHHNTESDEVTFGPKINTDLYVCGKNHSDCLSPSKRRISSIVLTIFSANRISPSLAACARSEKSSSTQSVSHV